MVSQNTDHNSLVNGFVEHRSELFGKWFRRTSDQNSLVNGFVEHQITTVFNCLTFQSLDLEPGVGYPRDASCVLLSKLRFSSLGHM